MALLTAARPDPKPGSRTPRAIAMVRRWCVVALLALAGSTCPAARSGCAFDSGGFGDGEWVPAEVDPAEDVWLSARPDGGEASKEWSLTRQALGAWKWKAQCDLCAMSPPASLGTPEQICSVFASTGVMSLFIVGDSTTSNFVQALYKRVGATIMSTAMVGKKRIVEIRSGCNGTLKTLFARDDTFLSGNLVVDAKMCTELRRHGLIESECMVEKDDNVKVYWPEQLAPRFSATIANVGAHLKNSEDFSRAMKRLDDAVAAMPRNATFLFRGLYTPIYNCQRQYLAGPASVELRAELEATMPEILRKQYAWFSLAKFNEIANKTIALLGPNVALLDLARLTTPRVDLHPQSDCLHWRPLRHSDVGVFKWWITLLVDYLRVMRPTNMELLTTAR